MLYLCINININGVGINYFNRVALEELQVKSIFNTSYKWLQFLDNDPNINFFWSFLCEIKLTALDWTGNIYMTQKATRYKEF